ncbi:hypothetical protein [Marichromatium purpuratum]|uniref:hypothetical protein n=1 Tax=Marichromatium purpuratum TaxID=37487 RepID=UPI0012EC184E|nr:hypothetical protein [Marichromatium purpuratum]
MPVSLDNFITYSLVALVSVIITRLVSRRSENMKNTLDMFRHYNSIDLLGARNRAWKFLNGDYKDNQISFEQLMSTHGESPDIYDDLAKVIYFWMSLCLLKMEGGVSKKMAIKLFARQYSDWEDAFRPLYESTKTESEYVPDWFILFENMNMAWLKIR